MYKCVYCIYMHTYIIYKIYNVMYDASINIILFRLVKRSIGRECVISVSALTMFFKNLEQDSIPFQSPRSGTE